MENGRRKPAVFVIDSPSEAYMYIGGYSLKNIIAVFFMALNVLELVIVFINKKPLTTLAMSVVSGLSVYSMFVITNVIELSCGKAIVSMALGAPGCILMIILDKLL